MTRLTTSIAALTAAAALFALPALADTPAKPPAKVAICAACHGENGVARMPMYPNLGGQYKNYIEQALHEYQNGERSNPIMGPMAKTLTQTDIEQLATWFSSQKPAVYTPSPYGALASEDAPKQEASR